MNSSEQNTEQTAEQESSVYRQSYVNDEHHNADDVSGNGTYYSQEATIVAMIVHRMAAIIIAILIIHRIMDIIIQQMILRQTMVTIITVTTITMVMVKEEKEENFNSRCCSLCSFTCRNNWYFSSLYFKE